MNVYTSYQLYVYFILLLLYLSLIFIVVMSVVLQPCHTFMASRLAK